MHDCSEDSNRPQKCATQARCFAHCDERPKALPLETASIFEKLLDQKTFRFKISKDFFDKLKWRPLVAISACRKTSFLIIVPIKSAGKFKYGQSKGTLYLAKRPLLKNSPLGCFVNSPLVNAPLRQGVSPSADGDEWRCPSTP